MRRAIRILQRAAIFGLGMLSIWLIVDVFKFVDHRLPSILALAATYAIGAYLILPNVVRMGLKILQSQHVPSFTITGDGLPGDPVNVALAGTLGQLRGAFAAAGWTEADPLNFMSSWRMVKAFVLNQPYPTAPFSTLYLFGRGQDIGFQKDIDNSPRKRHHIRFWAQSISRAQAGADTLEFWLNTDRPDDRERVIWVGAGTRDTGFSLTRLTFQITHATDADTDTERAFIVTELTRSGAIDGSTLFKAGDSVGHVNHYVTDGDIAVAEIRVPAASSVA
ncbi:MAG: LssY C-terminal domain-containing protein [Hyphomicrobium sp.]|uniref:LssY C-terminal domain-containing protein n=1 Tax=Hyphomicrobium sp. TaxID=82 RepID=UPI0039E384B9